MSQEGHHGWAPDVGAGGSERATEANRKAFGHRGSDTGQPSEPDPDGVPPTDPDASTPLGVGTSTTGPAYESEQTAGHKGESQRPYGTSTPEDATGVDPQGPIDPESPYLQPG